jgi:hypothetical protein
MSPDMRAELLETAPVLRAMAKVEISAEVRLALNRLADRYAAMAAEYQYPAEVTVAEELAA